MKINIDDLKEDLDRIERVLKEEIGETEDGNVDIYSRKLSDLESQIDRIEESLNSLKEVEDSVNNLRRRMDEIKGSMSTMSINFAEQKKSKDASCVLDELTKKLMGKRLDLCYAEAEAQVKRENPHLVTIIEE